MSAPEKRRRLRATRVCGRCRRLKLRCDRAHPCASCDRAGLRDGCAYAALGGLDARAVHAMNGVPTHDVDGAVDADADGVGEGDGAAELAALAALFPPDEAAHLAAFDALNRLWGYVPAHLFPGEDAAGLALRAAMCFLGAAAEERPTSALRRLTDSLLRHCTASGPHDAAYALASVLAAAAEAEDSPARAYVAAGAARSALFLAHDDGETARRTWYHLHIVHATAAARLALPCERPPVPPPSGDGWAFAASRVAWADLLCAQSETMRGGALAARLASAHAAIDAFAARAGAAGVPGLISRIEIHDAIVRLYRPYFVVGDERVRLLAAGIDPLARAVGAAHALAAGVAQLVARGECAYAAHAYTAGMAVAYAELAGRGSVHDLDVLEGALESLRACAARRGARTRAALAVLERVRRVVRARRAQRIERITRLRDPPAYEPQHAWSDERGQSPPACPQGSWDGWEELFRGFMESA
ncbi:unnamed protein product [Cutaneotrichosporon oleaginosum]